MACQVIVLEQQDKHAWDHLKRIPLMEACIEPPAWASTKVVSTVCWVARVRSPNFKSSMIGNRPVQTPKMCLGNSHLHIEKFKTMDHSKAYNLSDSWKKGYVKFVIYNFDIPEFSSALNKWSSSSYKNQFLYEVSFPGNWTPIYTSKKMAFTCLLDTGEIAFPRNSCTNCNVTWNFMH